MWLKSGDKNIKCFQQFFKGCRAHKTIWAMDDLDMGRDSLYEDLENMAKIHLSSLYNAPPKVTITYVILLDRSFLRFS